MNDLINEFLEAKAEKNFDEVLQEKIAALDITTESDFKALCEVIEEKAADLSEEKAADLRQAIGGAALAAIPATIIGGYLLSSLKKKSALDQVLRDKPDLKANAKRTTEHFDMLFHIAPTLMSNHIIAGSVLEQLAQYDLVDHQMVSKLIEAERNLVTSHAQSGAMSIIKSIGDTAKATDSVVKLLDPHQK